MNPPDQLIRLTTHVSYGTDPEGFIATADGKIVGAEKAIPKHGLSSEYTVSVVLDGVQFELHPQPGTTLLHLGTSIGNSFRVLADHLRTTHQDKFKIDFSQVVKVDADELSTLSEAARKLGCQPSENWYKKRPIKVPKDFPVRSAAGHLHLGVGAPINDQSYKKFDNRRHLVPLLDIFVGNTCVLLDRDPLAAERRKLYGHAGEYRTPYHGLEYRTTSNFWLKSYALMELVFGLATTAIGVLSTTITNETTKGTSAFNPEAILAEKFDAKQMKLVQRAIEKNDAKLAWKNWLLLEGFIRQHVPPVSGVTAFPVHTNNIDQVTQFLKVASNDGLKPYLPADPVQHWTSLFGIPKRNLYGLPTPTTPAVEHTWPGLLAKVTTAQEPGLLTRVTEQVKEISCPKP